MKSFSILLARPEPVAAAGSSSGERGLPACGFRLLAETDFLLPLALDEFTIPVRSKTRRGELGLWRLAKTDVFRIGEHTHLACNANPARTYGALAENALRYHSDFARLRATRTFDTLREPAIKAAIRHLPRKQPLKRLRELQREIRPRR